MAWCEERPEINSVLETASLRSADSPTPRSPGSSAAVRKDRPSMSGADFEREPLRRYPVTIPAKPRQRGRFKRRARRRTLLTRTHGKSGAGRKNKLGDHSRVE